MLRRLTLLLLLGMLTACNPAPEVTPPPPVAEHRPPAMPALQARALSARCATVTGERFRREWRDGSFATEDGMLSAGFESHYNARMNLCFYLLTVRHVTVGGEAEDSVHKALFALSDEETYGEFIGLARVVSVRDAQPRRCKLDELYCSSEGEWNVLAAQYMHD